MYYRYQKGIASVKVIVAIVTVLLAVVGVAGYLLLQPNNQVDSRVMNARESANAMVKNINEQNIDESYKLLTPKAADLLSWQLWVTSFGENDVTIQDRTSETYNEDRSDIYSVVYSTSTDLNIHLDMQYVDDAWLVNFYEVK